MKFDELYKFIGYSLVCLLGFYIVAKSIRFQVGVVEGLVGINKKKTVDVSGNNVSADADADEAEADEAETD